MPDVFVAEGVKPGRRCTWKVWEEQAGPRVVIEVTSKSSRIEDLGAKKLLYEDLGVERQVSGTCSWTLNSLGAWCDGAPCGWTLRRGSIQKLREGARLGGPATSTGCGRGTGSRRGSRKPTGQRVRMTVRCPATGQTVHRSGWVQLEKAFCGTGFMAGLVFLDGLPRGATEKRCCPAPSACPLKVHPVHRLLRGGD